MNWETFLTQVLKPAALAALGVIATKVVSETTSQKLTKTEQDKDEIDTTHKDTLTYLKQRTKELGIR